MDGSGGSKSQSPQSLGNRGQISVMIAVMMTTFILLFAFVINTGMLVHARINIQNAADLAAYAGAAVQARQMTHISYVNYEMRRQWKKFLFKIYVVGSAALPGFGTGGSGEMNYYINNTGGAPTDMQVPATCIIFSSNDNYCQVSTLTHINIPAQSYLDSITDTLRTQLQQIESIREQSCSMIGLTNKLLNYYWVYNADPTMAQLTAQQKAAANVATSDATLAMDQAKALGTVIGLSKELGIVPREIILSKRIDTLASYLNTPAQGALNLEGAQSLYSKTDVAAYERPIQAFFSAYYTLGNHLFNGSTMTVEEFLPNPTFQYSTYKQSFDIYAVDKVLNAQNDCVVQLVPTTVGSTSPNTGVPLAVTKDPTTMVAYAVRVKAEAQILFSPFGNIQMKAYAAAQPFGSRIGPSIPQNGFSHGSSPPGSIFRVLALALLGKYRIYPWPPKTAIILPVAQAGTPRISYPVHLIF